MAFSNYVWNAELAESFAQAIKGSAPRTVIVFGGPNYPTERAEQERWLRAHRVVDFYLVKEGEAAFANLIAALMAHDGDVEAVKRQRLPSTHAVTAGGDCILTDTLARLTDLTERNFGLGGIDIDQMMKALSAR